MTTETNAEWLQQIKQNHEGLVAYTADIGSDVINLPRINSDMAFLIERAHELEVSNKRCVQVALNRQRHIDNIESENARLREALWQLNDSIDAELATEIRPIGRTTLKNRIGRALKGESS